ncbi:hypothetical protein A2U01_0068880, partial [Trifolium medium]|nr:hypothetical protein [Trifolium medium]
VFTPRDADGDLAENATV